MPNLRLALVLTLSLAVTLGAGLVWAATGAGRPAASTKSGPPSAIASGGAVAGRTAAASAMPDASAPLDLKVGQENRVEDPRSQSYIIYVPTDYTPDRAWPVIFYMHGTGGKPTLGPLRQMFDGKTFILVGHEYVFRSQAQEDHKVETENLRRAVTTVQKNLHVDSSQMFLGGFSQGGWWTTMLAEYTMDMWAGLFTMGSGEHASQFPRPVDVRGKPIFIGAGENDGTYLPMAKQSVEAYQKRGAAVTFEWFPGLGHSDAVAKSEALKNFLLSNGPLRAVKTDLAAGQAAEKAGRLGQAYAAYSRIATLADTAECKTAQTSAKTIADGAEKALADARAAADAKNYAAAVKAYTQVAATYVGSPLADKAAQALAAMQADPAIGPLLAQAKIDAAADALEQQAQAAEAAKDYERAIKLYDQSMATYPKATRAEAVKKHLAGLRADPALQAAIREKQAEKDCRAWLSLAENLISAGQLDKARPHLRKILDQYPGTSWADKAAARLKAIGE